MSRTRHKEKAAKRKYHKAGCKCWQCEKFNVYKNRKQLEKANQTQDDNLIEERE